MNNRRNLWRALAAACLIVYSVAAYQAAFPLPTSVDARAYNFLRINGASFVGGQRVTGDLSASGAGKVLTFQQCPAGIAAGKTIRISGGTGTAENAAVTATTCPSAGGTGGTVTITTANTHTGPWEARSATGGTQEAFSAGNTSVRLPAATVHWYDTVYLIEGQTLSGEGYASTVSFRTANKHAIQIGQSNVISPMVTVRDFVLRSVPTNSTSGYGIRIYGARRTMIDHVSVEYFHSGIGASDATSTLIVQNSTLYYLGGNDDGSTRAAARGIFADVQASLDISNVKIYPTGGLGSCAVTNKVGYAIEVIQAGGLVIDHETDTFCHAKGLGLNPVDNGADPRVIEYGSISGTFDTNSLVGIEIKPSGSSIVHHMKFPDGWASNSGLIGVEINPQGTSRVDTINFSHGRYMRNGQYSLYMNKAPGATLQNIRIESNDFRGHVVADGVTQTAAIYIGGGAAHVKVADNSIGSSPTFPVAPAVGVETDGASDYIAIQNNDLSMTTQAIKHAATGQRIFIEGNNGVDDAWAELASANAVTLPDSAVSAFRLTGSTAVTELSPTWNRRRVTLYRAAGGAIALNTGGTAGVGLSKSVTLDNGDSVTLEFIEGFWWPVAN